VIAELAERAAEGRRIAIDTEFVSERRYQALLCLIQVAVPDPDAEGGVRTEVLDPLEGELDFDLAEGLVGDTWRMRGSGRTPDGSAHPDMQLNVINARLSGLIAIDPDRRALDAAAPRRLQLRPRRNHRHRRQRREAGAQAADRAVGPRHRRNARRPAS
jgi:hypothetical protein